METRRNSYDGLTAEDLERLRARRLEATQRTICPECLGKCLTFDGGWQPCQSCAGKGWLLERVWLERTPEDNIDGDEAFVMRRAYVIDELSDGIDRSDER